MILKYTYSNTFDGIEFLSNFQQPFLESCNEDGLVSLVCFSQFDANSIYKALIKYNKNYYKFETNGYLNLIFKKNPSKASNFNIQTM